MRLMPALRRCAAFMATEATVSNFGIREYILTVCVSGVLRWPSWSHVRA